MVLIFSFMLNILPALLTNWTYRKCLSYVGTEGSARDPIWPKVAVWSVFSGKATALCATKLFTRQKSLCPQEFCKRLLE